MFTQDYNKYANLLYTSQNTLRLFKIFLLKFGFYLNNNNIKKNPKQFCLSSTVTSEITTLKQLIETNYSENFNLKTERNTRNSLLREKINNSNRLNIKLPWLGSNFSNLDFLKNHYALKFDESKSILIWPSLISQYIESQLDKPPKKKNRFFNRFFKFY